MLIGQKLWGGEIGEMLLEGRNLQLEDKIYSRDIMDSIVVIYIILRYILQSYAVCDI